MVPTKSVSEDILKFQPGRRPRRKRIRDIKGSEPSDVTENNENEGSPEAKRIPPLNLPIIEWDARYFSSNNKKLSTRLFLMILVFPSRKAFSPVPSMIPCRLQISVWPPRNLVWFSYFEIKLRFVSVSKTAHKQVELVTTVLILHKIVVEHAGFLLRPGLNLRQRYQR